MDFVDSKCICEYTGEEHSQGVYLPGAGQPAVFGGWLAGAGALWRPGGRRLYPGDR